MTRGEIRNDRLYCFGHIHSIRLRRTGTASSVFNESTERAPFAHAHQHRCSALPRTRAIRHRVCSCSCISSAEAQWPRVSFLFRLFYVEAECFPVFQGGRASQHSHFVLDPQDTVTQVELRQCSARHSCRTTCTSLANNTHTIAAAV